LSEPTSEPAVLNGHPENRQTDNRVLESSTSEPQARLMLLRDVVGDARADADAAHESRLSGKPRGAVTGLANLDRELSGAFAPGLHFVHGNAGTGKTAFALQTAADCQSPAMFVTCEMAPAELLRRHTARATKTYLNRLKSGEMTGADVQRLTLQAIEKAPALAFVDATGASAPVAFLHDSAQIVKGDAKHLLIVIDSLHSWAGGLENNLPEYEALNAAVGDLQRLSRRLSCAILIVSERNRDSMKSGGINAGAGTRKIEYGAETVIDLERASDAKEDGAGEVEVTLKLAKNRHGAAGKPIKLKFHGALQRFTEADKA